MLPSLSFAALKHTARQFRQHNQIETAAQCILQEKARIQIGMIFFGHEVFPARQHVVDGGRRHACDFLNGSFDGLIALATVDVNPSLTFFAVIHGNMV